MSLRIREDGSVVCAAMHPAEPGDTYLHDGISYRLTVEYGVIVTDRYHLRADGDPEPDWSKCNCGAGPSGVHSGWCYLIKEREVLDGHGLWWWRDEVPEGIEPEIMAHLADSPGADQ